MKNTLLKKSLSCLMALMFAVMCFAGCSKKGEPETTAAPTTAAPAAEAPTTAAPDTETLATTEPTTAAQVTKAQVTKAQVTKKPSQTKPAAPATKAMKKGEVYKTAVSSKIWAGVVGTAYIVFKNIDTANEWGEKGLVYEIYVAQVGNNHTMWSDGYWELSSDKTTLKLTPKNQSENGNIGVEAGSTKTFTAENGTFTIPLTFEQGGKTTIKLVLSSDAV